MIDPQFLWGAATSSHQIEGHNHLNDWWDWEQQGKVKEKSDAACNHHELYADDIALVSKLGHNAHRFSLEWSRLEPREGEWDEAAFDHYEDVFRHLAARQITPVVTLHHFTNPTWFTKKGGWLSPETAYYFGRYTQKVVERFSPYVKFWITINEPLIFLYFSYLEGTWPPGLKSFPASMVVFENLLLAHIESYTVIHDFYRLKLQKPVHVSIAKHLGCFTPSNPHSVMDNLSVWLRNWFFNDLFLNALQTGYLFFPGVFSKQLPRQQTLDFIGVNYYQRDFIEFGGFSLLAAIGQSASKEKHKHEIGEINTMGWEIYPQGLYQVLMRLKKYKLPVMITENGTCTQDDDQRSRYIRTHLAALKQASDEGMNVWGYFYWSLMDNFEWAHGFDPRFGIVEVDYITQKRTVRKSAYVLQEICRNLSAGNHNNYAPPKRSF